MLTLEDLKLAILNKEDLSEKLKQCVIPSGQIDLDDLTVEEYLVVCLTLYYKSDKKILNERGYFYKIRGEQQIGLAFLNAPNGFFITALWGLEGDEPIYE